MQGIWWVLRVHGEGAAPESPAAMRGWGPAVSLRRRRRRLAKSLGGHGLRSFEKECV